MSYARPIEVWESPCNRCPSAHGPGDPESLDIQTWPEEDRVKMVFECAWRSGKLCKGVCDNYGYQKEKHADLIQLAN